MKKAPNPLEALLKAGTATRFVVVPVEALRDFAHTIVREVLEQAGAKPPEKAILSPDEVRTLAGCSSARVSAALSSGELVATRVDHGEPRIARDGRTIPSFRWRIDRAEAEAFARKVNAARHGA